MCLSQQLLNFLVSTLVFATELADKAEVGASAWLELRDRLLSTGRICSPVIMRTSPVNDTCPLAKRTSPDLLFLMVQVHDVVDCCKCICSALCAVIQACYGPCASASSRFDPVYGVPAINALIELTIQRLDIDHLE